jgi:isoleucyl-tRNA synthetase
LVGKKESIHLQNFFKPETLDMNIEKEWSEFFELRIKVNQIIEDNIKNNVLSRRNEAHLIVNADSPFIKSLDLRVLLMVGKVTFGTELKASRFDSIKCQRCWNHFSKDEIKNDICLRCQKVVANLC